MYSRRYIVLPLTKRRKTNYKNKENNLFVNNSMRNNKVPRNNLQINGQNGKGTKALVTKTWLIVHYHEEVKNGIFKIESIW
jgi:hypothetical protein